MKDKEFLFWLESQLIRFAPHLQKYDLPRLRAIAERTPFDQDTPIGGDAQPDISTLITSFYLVYREHKPFKEIGDILNLMNVRMDKLEEKG